MDTWKTNSENFSFLAREFPVEIVSEFPVVRKFDSLNKLHQKHDLLLFESSEILRVCFWIPKQKAFKFSAHWHDEKVLWLSKQKNMYQIFATALYIYLGYSTNKTSINITLKYTTITILGKQQIINSPNHL